MKKILLILLFISGIAFAQIRQEQVTELPDSLLSKLNTEDSTGTGYATQYDLTQISAGAGYVSNAVWGAYWNGITDSTSSKNILYDVVSPLVTHLTSNGTDHSYIDQDVTTTGTPTFVSVDADSIELTSSLFIDCDLSANGDVLINTGEIAGATLPGIWFGANAGSPSFTNYAFLYQTGVGTIFNSPTGNLLFRIGNSTYMNVSTTNTAFTGSATISDDLTVGDTLFMPNSKYLYASASYLRTDGSFRAGGSGYFASIIGNTGGSVGSPIFQHTDDGMWFPSADNLALATGGVNALTIDSGQKSTFADTVIAPFMQVNQADDDVGIQVNGYDNVSDDYFNVSLDASGRASITTNSRLYFYPYNTLTSVFLSEGLRFYSDKYMAFGSASEFDQRYVSATELLQISDGTNIFTTWQDMGTTVRQDINGRLEVDTILTTVAVNSYDYYEAGENITQWDVCYMHSDGKMYKANATDGVESTGLILYAREAITSGSSGYFADRGQMTGLSGLTPGTDYFLSASSDGAKVTTAPTASGNRVWFIGTSNSTTTIRCDIEFITEMGL